MARYMVNMSLAGRSSLPAARRRRRMLHTATCRWAGRSARTYRLDLAGAHRLVVRAQRGDDDGLTRLCAYCVPDAEIMVLVDAT
jgi:hypothetical protein